MISLTGVVFIGDNFCTITCPTEHPKVNWLQLTINEWRQDGHEFQLRHANFSTIFVKKIKAGHKISALEFLHCHFLERFIT